MLIFIITIFCILYTSLTAIDPCSKYTTDTNSWSGATYDSFFVKWKIDVIPGNIQIYFGVANQNNPNWYYTYNIMNSFF